MQTLFNTISFWKPAIAIHKRKAEIDEKSIIFRTTLAGLAGMAPLVRGGFVNPLIQLIPLFAAGVFYLEKHRAIKALHRIAINSFKVRDVVSPDTMN